MPSRSSVNIKDRTKVTVNYWPFIRLVIHWFDRARKRTRTSGLLEKPKDRSWQYSIYLFVKLEFSKKNIFKIACILCFQLRSRYLHGIELFLTKFTLNGSNCAFIFRHILSFLFFFFQTNLALTLPYSRAVQLGLIMSLLTKSYSVSNHRNENYQAWKRRVSRG